MFKAKVLIIGPCRSGKTVIANFLSDATETSSDDYHPTQGCRILEFEINNIPVPKGTNVNAEVELWDCSGDNKFEGCWATLAKDVVGVVLVFDPDDANQDKNLEALHTYFVEQQGLRDSQCIVFANHKGSGPLSDDIQLPPSMSKLPCVPTNLEQDSEGIHHEFKHFLGTLITTMNDKRDQEELSIMNNR
ncbi:hypothetical protein NP493_895g00023 [Ridgeia piscesae]|uniref:Intraflagellar transport protein 22 homolog n=1 Tax=Ridgeia piscesae TaxID=27915 RepID=A0AAD9KKT8_RIDPI|nr:hypothetical protein NP493_895g00023 [Ridgeia piscesae]